MAVGVAPFNDSDRLITFETDAAFEDTAVTCREQKPYSPLKNCIHIMSEYLSQFTEKSSRIKMGHAPSSPEGIHL